MGMGKQKSCWPNAVTANTIISRIGSPASAFYATERYMNLPEFDHHTIKSSYQQYSGISVLSFQTNNDSSSSSLPQDSDYSLISTVEKCNYTTYPVSCRLSEKEQILQLKRKLLGDDDSDDENKKTKLSQTCSISPAGALQNCNKSRIRWTQELHDRFVKTVNHLGGENKATPKAILKMMDWEGLTIFQVKSHLQKYRNTKNNSENAEGRHERNSNTYTGVPIDNEIGMQIKEALQLQLDAQRRLHDQLEIQRKLQVSIEEQGRQLKMMMDQQQKTANRLLETRNSNITITSPISTALDDLEVVIPEIIENV